MSLIFERRYYAEVSSTAPEGPEQVRVLLVARPQQLPVGAYDVGAQQVVAGEAIFPIQVTDAATQGKARNPGRWYDAPGRGQTKSLSFSIEIAPSGSAFGTCCPPVRIHANSLHCR